jgi:hypothetical protein
VEPVVPRVDDSVLDVGAADTTVVDPEDVVTFGAFEPQATTANAQTTTSKPPALRPRCERVDRGGAS